MCGRRVGWAEWRERERERESASQIIGSTKEKFQ